MQPIGEQNREAPVDAGGEEVPVRSRVTASERTSQRIEQLMNALEAEEEISSLSPETKGNTKCCRDLPMKPLETKQLEAVGGRVRRRALASLRAHYDSVRGCVLLQEIHQTLNLP